MRYSVFLLVLITSVLVFLSFSWPEPTTQPDPSALYKQYCAQCHGQDLKGGNAQSMVDGIWQFGDGESYIFRNIKFGIPDLGMPSFEASLSDEQISSLVTYITNLEKEAGVDKPDFSEKLETQEYIMKMEVYAENLNIPWSIDFIDDETALITERPGNLYVVHQGSRNQNPVRKTPKVLHEGQGGLMDVAVDPQYEENGWIYLSYSHILDSKEERPPAMTRIVRGKIEDNKWSDEQVLYEAEHDHYSTMRHHYGSRIVFDPQGYLYFSVGDRGAREQAQELSRPNGKIHRINKDGSIPADNPFVDTQGALPTIFTYGNRNTQG
ncbi:MAG: PQQ-dependent sugar dehydrogenase, partial [Bacteroidota bacterium]